MAIDYSPFVRRTRVFAGKIESVPGDAEPLTATEAAYNCWDVFPQSEIEMEPREGQGGPAIQLQAQPGLRKGKFPFKTHCYGGSAQPTWAELLFPAVALGFSATKYVLEPLAPDATGSKQKCVTLASYQGKRKKSVYGAMGDLTLDLEAGKLVVATWDFSGKWAAPVDADILDPIYPSGVPLRAVNGGLLIGTFSPRVSKCQIKLNNSVVLRKDINADDLAGISHASVVLRPVTISIDPESLLVASKDFYGEFLAGTEAAFTITARAGTDDMTIAATKAQIMSIEEADRDGLEIDNLNLTLNAQDLNILFT